MVLLWYCFASMPAPLRYDSSVKANEHHLKSLLGTLMSCRTAIDDHTACNVFVARGTKLCFGIRDFCKPGDGIEDETYPSANEIAEQAKQHWHLIGPAGQQLNLNRAQAYANGGRPVIAVRSVPGDHGHVCLILPGELTHSSTWGLKVPNSASFRLDDVKGCYVGGRLSKAFGADKKDTVLLYQRK
jgi:hypothetical protein